MGGMPGMGGMEPPNVVRLTEEEMASVNRLVDLGFDQQQAAQAFLACDRNEQLAANFLLEGGFGEDGGDFGGQGDFGQGGDDHDMYDD
jgi:UV excision repair protein RAD23